MQNSKFRIQNWINKHVIPHFYIILPAWYYGSVYVKMVGIYLCWKEFADTNCFSRNFFRKSCTKRPQGTICGVATSSSVKWMLRTFEAIKRSPFFNPPPTRRPSSANYAVRVFIFARQPHFDFEFCKTRLRRESFSTLFTASNNPCGEFYHPASESLKKGPFSALELYTSLG